MIISACAYAIDMVSFLVVWSSKSAHNLIVHFRSNLAPSLFLAESLKKVPDIQYRVHNTTPPSGMSMCTTRPHHVAKQCFVAILARPVIVSALRKKKNHLILRLFIFHTLDTRIRFTLDTRVNRPFFQVLTPKFGHSARSWLQDLDLALEHSTLLRCLE